MEKLEDGSYKIGDYRIGKVMATPKDKWAVFYKDEYLATVKTIEEAKYIAKFDNIKRTNIYKFGNSVSIKHRKVV